MRTLFTNILAIAVVATAAHGQGLESIGPGLDTEEKSGLSGSLSTSLGWDSNPGARPNGPAGSAELSAVENSDALSERGADGNSESAYWLNELSLTYPLARGRTSLLMNGFLSSRSYLDAPPGVDEFSHDWHFSVDFARQQTSRLALTDLFYISQQTEPDFGIGASDNRPSNGYFFGSNHLSATYLWTRRFSTVTSYTVTSIRYDDDDFEIAPGSLDPGVVVPVEQSRDYDSHTFNQQFRYELSRSTTATMEYRYQLTRYTENDTANSTSHILLAGLQRRLGRSLDATLSAGAETREYERPLGSRTAPYMESALVYHPGRRMSLRWFQRLGLEDRRNPTAQSSEVVQAAVGEPGTEPSLVAQEFSTASADQSLMAYRTGLTFQHEITPRLSLNLSLNYAHTEPADGDSAGSLREIEDTIDASVGLNYRLWRSVSLSAMYSYTDVSSNNPFREYDRQRISVGLTYQF